MVVPTLVNFVDGCYVDWRQLGTAADGLVDGDCCRSSVDMDGLFSIGLPSADGKE